MMSAKRSTVIIVLRFYDFVVQRYSFLSDTPCKTSTKNVLQALYGLATR